MNRILLCLPLLGACTAPQSVPSNGHAGLNDGVVSPVVEPTDYLSWLDTLPGHLEQASEPFAADFHGKMEVQVPGEDVAIELQMSGSVEYVDLRHFREEFVLRMDLGKVDPSLPEGPVAVSLVIDADGEMLYIEPRFHDDWLQKMIVETGMGFERMTFTLDLDLLEDMLSVYWEFLASNDADLSEFLPEGMTMEEFFANGMNPAAWARMYLLTAEITDFHVDSSEVRITARLKEEWTKGIMMESDPLVEEMMQNMSYEVCFDRYSGLPSSFSIGMSRSGEMDFGFSLEFENFQLDADLFEPGHFQHGSTKGRTVFPLDPFVSMSLRSMEGMMEEDDDDVPF